jgi:hypothetical protein
MTVGHPAAMHGKLENARNGGCARDDQGYRNGQCLTALTSHRRGLCSTADEYPDFIIFLASKVAAGQMMGAGRALELIETFLNTHLSGASRHVASPTPFSQAGSA